LDLAIGGLKAGELTILAGRKGMGKTLLSSQIAFNVAEAYMANDDEGPAVGIFSLHRAAENISQLMLCRNLSVSSSAVNDGILNVEELAHLKEAIQNFNHHPYPIFIDDTPSLSYAALHARAIRLQQQHDIGLIIIDYIQLVTIEKSSRNQAQEQNVTRIISGVKQLAKELNIPILALYQLPESVDYACNNRPDIAGLYELGEAFSSMDSAWVLYREQHDLESNEPVRTSTENSVEFMLRHKRWKQCIKETEGNAEIRVAYHKCGTKTLKLKFDKTIPMFKDFDDASS